MGFAYGLGGFERFSILDFSDSPLFFCFFSDFEGGLEIGVIPKGSKHAIHLWFGSVGGSFNRAFSENGCRLKRLTRLKRLK